MKEVETKETPEISGGELSTYGTPLPTAYPIIQVPAPEQPDPLIIPEAPLP